MEPKPSASDEAILSPLYDPLGDDARMGEIRDYDYGDREDVVAEEEEVRHELNALESTDNPAHYPPSGSLDGHRKWRKRKGMNALSLGLRKHRAKLRSLMCLILFWPFVSWAIIYCLFAEHPALFPRSLKEAKSTLLVVAHPDDECLFFAPSILANVWRAKSHGALLVMSSGNHYGLGDVRKKELKESCRQLGIREERCNVMDVSSVQDDPDHWWPVSTVLKIVQQHIDQWMIDSLITFDDGGVSGHINHRAVSAAVTQLALSLNSTNPLNTSGTRPSPSLFVVKSVFVLRKYSGLYDLPFSFFPFIPSIIFGPSSQSTMSLSPAYDAQTEKSTLESEARRKDATRSSEKGLLLSGWSDYRSARNAFWSHRSQLVWDRHLYMVLSRYMYFNTIERVI